MIEIVRLMWDDGNVAHIARHGVVPQEVEEVCQNNPLVQQGHHGRRVVIGATHAGRMLEVVLDPEPEEGVYYVVTAHTASRKDRALYLKEKGGEAA